MAVTWEEMEAAIVKLRNGGVHKAGEVQLKLLWNIDEKLGELIDLAKGAAETRAEHAPFDLLSTPCGDATVNPDGDIVPLIEHPVGDASTTPPAVITTAATEYTAVGARPHIKINVEQKSPLAETCLRAVRAVTQEEVIIPREMAGPRPALKKRGRPPKKGAKMEKSF